MWWLPHPSLLWLGTADHVFLPQVRFWWHKPRYQFCLQGPRSVNKKWAEVGVWPLQLNTWFSVFFIFWTWTLKFKARDSARHVGSVVLARRWCSWNAGALGGRLRGFLPFIHFTHISFHLHFMSLNCTGKDKVRFLSVMWGLPSLSHDLLVTVRYVFSLFYPQHYFFVVGGKDVVWVWICNVTCVTNS